MIKPALPLLMSTAVALLIAACGGDDDATPSAKCHQLMAAFCVRATECGSTRNQTDCVNAYLEKVTCDKATAVTSSYDKCVADTKVQACQDPGIPNTCNMIFTFGK